MLRRFDIAVVGSGPAGAACALRLARAGYAVALVDEREFPRYKLCGEYLNLGAIREFQDLGIAHQLEPLAASLHGMRLFAHDVSAAFHFSSPAWSMPRTVLDERIRRRALDSGAQAVHGRVCGIEDGESSVLLSLERNGERFTIDARYLVGADGMRSSVARFSGLTVPVSSARFATGGHYAASGSSDWIEMFAQPQGYLAINPLSPVSVNAMFVFNKDQFRRHRTDVGGELTRFSNRVTAGRRVIRDEQLVDRRRAIGPLAHATSAPVRGRVVLVGDAARFVDPFTGQGVFLALAGARLASVAIRRAYTKENARTAAWRSYTRDLSALFNERERVAALLRVMLISRVLSQRTASALRKRPCDFAFLIDAVCGDRQLSYFELAGAVGRALL